MAIISLIGFMGAGKTTIGKQLAHALQIPFHDLDSRIETLCGKPIPEIFAQDGEPLFRSHESHILQETLSTTSQAILATGGGIILDPENRRLLSQHTLCLFLDPPVEELFRRTSRHSNRPLADSNLADFTARRQKRLPLYHETAHAVFSGIHPPEHLVEQIIRFLKARENPT